MAHQLVTYIFLQVAISSLLGQAELKDYFTLYVYCSYVFCFDGCIQLVRSNYYQCNPLNYVFDHYNSNTLNSVHKKNNSIPTWEHNFEPKLSKNIMKIDL